MKRSWPDSPDQTKTNTARLTHARPTTRSEAKRLRDEKMSQPFRLFDLPAELRESVYYYALVPIKPIDTAAIPNTPDRIRIPPLAQLSRQTRGEVLHVLFKSRPVEISLHSSENLRRALLWAERWHEHTGGLPQLIFSGAIAQYAFDFFHITLNISDEAPFFTASAKKAASTRSDKYVAEMKTDMLDWLAIQMKDVQKERRLKLSGDALKELIQRVADLSNKGDVPRGYRY